MDKRSKEYKAKAKNDEAVLTEALERFDIAQEAWSEVYKQAINDIRFVDEEGAQWTEDEVNKRKTRPCMTFDKVSQALNQVVGDHLQNKPGIKVRGAEDDDADTAETYEGLIRQIEQRGKNAYKTAFKFAVKGGYGAFELTHDYIGEDSMDQDIILSEIKNPFSTLLDPIVQVEGPRRMRYGFKFNDLPRSEFETLYPKAKSSQTETFRTGGNSHEWMNQNTVRVARYYRLVSDEYDIVQLSDGRVVRDDDDLAAIKDELAEKQIVEVNRRPVDGLKLECYQITGAEVLEKVECVGALIPIVPVFGMQSNINGKFLVRGMVNKSRDAQKFFNLQLNNFAEVGALVPKQQYQATRAMLDGHEPEWKNMNTSGDPVLFANFDNGQLPQRVGAAQVPIGLIQGMQIAEEGIKSATGKHDASLGSRSNETSGVAIQRRQLEGDTATYEFTDELVDAMTYAGEIEVQWIPKVYDGTRQIRILGEDDAEKVVRINQPELDIESGETITLNDLSRGKYDVKVTVGASYSTRRVETQEQLAQIMSSSPEMGQLVADIYMKSLDIVGADEAVKRIRMHLIKQGIAEPTDEEKEELMQKQQQNQQPPDPAEQFMKELSMRAAELNVEREQKEIAEIESKTNLNQHKAAQIRFDTTTGQLVSVQ